MISMIPGNDESPVAPRSLKSIPPLQETDLQGPLLRFPEGFKVSKTLRRRRDERLNQIIVVLPPAAYEAPPAPLALQDSM
jgi:hypothetical protein